MPLAMSPFSVEASTASVMFPHLPAQFAVPQGAQRRQHTDDAGIPLSAEELHAVFQRTADVFFQFSLIHDSNSFFVFSGYLYDTTDTFGFQVTMKLMSDL